MLYNIYSKNNERHQGQDMCEMKRFVGGDKGVKPHHGRRLAALMGMPGTPTVLVEDHAPSNLQHTFMVSDHDSHTTPGPHHEPVGEMNRRRSHGGASHLYRLRRTRQHMTCAGERTSTPATRLSQQTSTEKTNRAQIPWEPAPGVIIIQPMISGVEGLRSPGHVRRDHRGHREGHNACCWMHPDSCPCQRW